MNVNDYILKEDVYKLSADEWASFRQYLKLIGFRIDDSYGCGNPRRRGHAMCAFIDPDGDLMWANYITSGKQITIDEVRKMAQLGLMS